MLDDIYFIYITFHFILHYQIYSTLHYITFYLHYITFYLSYIAYVFDGITPILYFLFSLQRTSGNPSERVLLKWVPDSNKHPAQQIISKSKSFTFEILGYLNYRKSVDFSQTTL